MGIVIGEVRLDEVAVPPLKMVSSKPALELTLPAFVSGMLKDFNGFKYKRDYEAFFDTVGPLDPVALEAAGRVIWASSWAYERKEGTATRAVDLTQSFCRQIVEANLKFLKLSPAFEELYQREHLTAEKAVEIAEDIHQSAISPRTGQWVGPLLQPCFMGKMDVYPTFSEFMAAYGRSGGLTEQVLMLATVQDIPPRELEYVRQIEATGIRSSFKHFVLMAHCSERLDSKLRRSRAFRRMAKAAHDNLWAKRGTLQKMFESYPGGGKFGKDPQRPEGRKSVDSVLEGSVPESGTA